MSSSTVSEWFEDKSVETADENAITTALENRVELCNGTVNKFCPAINQIVIVSMVDRYQITEETQLKR